MLCPQCQAENHDSRSKCWQCGGDLTSVSAPQPRPITSAPHPRPPRHRGTVPVDVSTGAKVGIIIVSVVIPIVGLIWGIVYLCSGQKAKRTWGAIGVSVAVIVGLLVGILTPYALNLGQARARQMLCLSNMKELALGLLMCAQDYDEVLPDVRNWQTMVSPYLLSSDVFRCPEGGYYAMNPRLSRISLTQISNPAQTVLLYEVDADGKPLYNAHLGGANYAYADGSCKWLHARDVKK